MRATLLRYGSVLVAIAIIWLGLVAHRLRATADEQLPRVELNAAQIGPRPIEDLTSKSVPRDYALAWQTLEQAQAENQPGLLDGYFTGLAHQELAERVASEIESGLHTRYIDHGHRLDAVFYSPAGDIMELRDRAQLDIEILDGSRAIYDQPVTAEYVVVMTPGADRWLVRQLQAVNGTKP
jgi:hypothetical protein